MSVMQEYVKVEIENYYDCIFHIQLPVMYFTFKYVRTTCLDDNKTQIKSTIR
jgi:hypothetical protein